MFGPRSAKVDVFRVYHAEALLLVGRAAEAFDIFVATTKEAAEHGQLTEVTKRLFGAQRALIAGASESGAIAEPEDDQQTRTAVDDG